jgi:hypothetical protein
MGLIALGLYTMFLVTPLRKLAAIARQTFAQPDDAELHYLALGLQASLLVFMVSSFFLSVAYAWNVYYLVGYAVCFRKIYESKTGRFVVLERKRSTGNSDEVRNEAVHHEPAVA